MRILLAVVGTGNLPSPGFQFQEVDLQVPRCRGWSAVYRWYIVAFQRPVRAHRTWRCSKLFLISMSLQLQSPPNLPSSNQTWLAGKSCLYRWCSQLSSIFCRGFPSCCAVGRPQCTALRCGLRLLRALWGVAATSAAELPGSSAMSISICDFSPWDLPFTVDDKDSPKKNRINIGNLYQFVACGNYQFEFPWMTKTSPPKNRPPVFWENW